METLEQEGTLKRRPYSVLLEVTYAISSPLMRSTSVPLLTYDAIEDVSSDQPFFLVVKRQALKRLDAMNLKIYFPGVTVSVSSSIRSTVEKDKSDLLLIFFLLLLLIAIFLLLHATGST